MLDFMPVVMGNHGIAVQKCWRIWVFHGWFWVTPKGEPLCMKLIRCRVCCTLPQIQLTLSINLTALTKTHNFILLLLFFVGVGNGLFGFEGCFVQHSLNKYLRVIERHEFWETPTFKAYLPSLWIAGSGREGGVCTESGAESVPLCWGIIEGARV